MSLNCITFLKQVNASLLYHRQIISCCFFITCCDAAVSFQETKAAYNNLAVAVR